MNWYFLRDGQQVGPLAWQDLWSRGQGGELRPFDLVWTDGMAQWQPASAIPGLFPGLPAPPPVPQRAPAPQSAAPQPAAAPYQATAAPTAAPYGYARPAVAPAQTSGNDEVMRMILPVGRSGWAIAAGYLGLLAILGIFAPFALLTGGMAVWDIRKNPHKHGMGRAVFGIVMGALGSIGLIVLLMAAGMN